MKIYQNSIYNKQSFIANSKGKQVSFEKNFKEKLLTNTLENKISKDDDKKRNIVLGLGLLSVATIMALTLLLKGKKPPKYLYHITTIDNYKSMLRDGVVNKSDSRMGDGVFFSSISDLKNKYGQNLNSMLAWYSGKFTRGLAPKNPSGKVVVLKIPVKGNESKIKWRPISLNQFLPESFDWIDLKSFGEWKHRAKHKKPLEYLYTENIPIGNMTKVAEVDLKDCDNSNIVKTFWENICI